MSLSTSLTPFQQAILKLSQESPLVHRNHDRTDPPYITTHIPRTNHEPLLPTSLCDACTYMEFLPSTYFPEAHVEAIRSAFPRDEDWVCIRRLFYIHHPSLLSLKNSAENGCHCCLLIWNDAFSNFEWTKEELARDDAVLLNQMLGVSENEWSESWWPGNGSSLGVTWGGREFAFGKMVFLQLSHEMTRILQKNLEPPLSPLKSVRLAKSWLANCWINHPGCFQAKIPRSPTRLIDVGSADGLREPRLYEPKEPARYVTLSHCWGGGRVAMTTSANFPERCKAIPLHTLSKVFQEAIKVTREFGVRYIWIDSLCIIQDSSSDWERESAKMCSVYKNVLFTIAASRATSGADGLFIPQPPHLHTPSYLPHYAFLAEKGSRFNIHLAPSLIDNHPGTTQYVPKGPLYDRAWVLQEEALSHATLAFTSEGMTWQCSSATSVSKDPEGVKDHQRMSCLRDAIMLGKRYSRNPVLVRNESEKWEEQHPDSKGMDERTWVRPGRIQMYTAWAEMVEQYLTRSITHASDRLPALSGLAQGMQDVLSDSYSVEEYLAGLWRFDLERGLMWTPHFHSFSSVELHKQFEKMGFEGRRKRRVRPPMMYLGPSWSWASLWETPVGWGRHYGAGWGEGWIEVVGTEKWVRGGNRFGGLEDAALTLRGVLCPVIFRGDGGLYDAELGKKVGKLLLDEDGSVDELDEVVLMPILTAKHPKNGDGYGI